MLYVFSSIKIHTRTLQHFIVVASVAEVCARQGLIVIWSLLLLFCLFFIFIFACYSANSSRGKNLPEISINCFV